MFGNFEGISKKLEYGGRNKRNRRRYGGIGGWGGFKCGGDGGRMWFRGG